MRNIWADQGSRLFIIAAVVLTLVVPLILAVTLPDRGPDPGFLLDLGHDWTTRGPITFLASVFCSVVGLPVLLWRTRRRLQRR